MGGGKYVHNVEIINQTVTNVLLLHDSDDTFKLKSYLFIS